MNANANKFPASILALLLSMTFIYAQNPSEESLKSILTSRFRNGKPIRLAFDVTTTSTKLEGAAKNVLKTLHYYEINPIDAKTWRFDSLDLNKTGRGGGQLSTVISKNGVKASYNAAVDEGEIEDYLRATFEIKRVKVFFSAVTDLGESYGTANPEYLDRWFGITFEGVSFDRLFSLMPKCKLLLEKDPAYDGVQLLKLQIQHNQSHSAVFDLEKGVLRSYEHTKNADGSGPIEVVKAFGGKRIADSVLFGVADRIVAENHYFDGRLEKSEILVHQDKSRLLTQEEFQERLNPELPLGAYVSKDKAGQSSTIIEEDLPVRLWDYEKLFTPERKAKGLIDYLKKAQE